MPLLYASLVRPSIARIALMAHLHSPAQRMGSRNVLASPASLLPSPLDKKYGLSGACSSMVVGEGTLKFDDILVSDSDSAGSSQDALEAFSQLETNAEGVQWAGDGRVEPSEAALSKSARSCHLCFIPSTGRLTSTTAVKSGSQLELFVPFEKVAVGGDDQVGMRVMGLLGCCHLLLSALSKANIEISNCLLPSVRKLLPPSIAKLIHLPLLLCAVNSFRLSW